MRVNLTDGVSCDFPDADSFRVENGCVVLRSDTGIVVADYPRSEVESVELE